MTRTVAIFLPSLSGGGAEKVMVTLANAFADRGIEVDLVLAKAEGPFLQDVSPKVTIVDLGASRVLASLPGLVRYLRRRRPQVLLSALHYANVIAVIAGQLSRAKIRVVVSERNNLTVTIANTKSIREKALIYLMRWIYPKADGVIAISKGVADDLAIALDIPRQTIQVVYNPAYAHVLPKQSNQTIRHFWFERGQPPVILGVGRLHKQKNFPMLIRAFAEVSKKRNVRLMILGEGPERLFLESLVSELHLEDKVLLPGFQGSLHEYMRCAQLFVLSSSWEGFGNVLVEAMACGTPVISTDCPSGPAEILENGKWGLLVPVNDEEALASAMMTQLENEAPPDVKTRAADFGIEQAVSGYLRVLMPDIE